MAFLCRIQFKIKSSTPPFSISWLVNSPEHCLVNIMFQPQCIHVDGLCKQSCHRPTKRERLKDIHDRGKYHSSRGIRLHLSTSHLICDPLNCSEPFAEHQHLHAALSNNISNFQNLKFVCISTGITFTNNASVKPYNICLQCTSTNWINFHPYRIQTTSWTLYWYNIIIILKCNNNILDFSLKI